MKWEVSFHEEFDSEFDARPIAVQDELLAHAKLLEQFGPQLGRPRVDNLNNSRHANMKELRFDAAEGVCASLSPLTRREGPFFWSAATSQAAAKDGSTASSWLRPTNGLTGIWPD